MCFIRKTFYIVVPLIVLLLAGCSQNTNTNISFGPWMLSVDQSYQNKYVDAEDVGNAIEKVLTFRQEEDTEEQQTADTLMIIQLNQYIAPATQMKNAFAKNYQRLLGYKLEKDETLTIDCEDKAGALLQFHYDDNPLDDTSYIITQLYLTDDEKKQSYMLSQLTQQKKTAKALIKKMKEITCKE